jgi:hypothetical protein
MRRRYTVFGLALVAAFVATSGHAFEVALEAESGVITAPMVVGVPADAAAQGGPEPGGASGAGFVWAPGPPVTGDDIDHTGGVAISFNIPAAGTYAVWGLVAAWDGNSDSFWVKIDGADPDEDPQETQNTHFRWGVEQGNDWHWDRINQWLDGGTFEREWELSAGANTLSVLTREAACMLDYVLITDNLSENVDDISFVPPAAVEAMGKLATTWAELRR